MKPKDPHPWCLLLILLLPLVQSKILDKPRRQLDAFTQDKLQEEIRTKIEPLLEKRLQEIVNMPGNQELSKSQIRYLLQQSIKKIQPERFYVDKNEQAKNPSFIGYLSTQDNYIKPDTNDAREHFTLPVNFHIPTTKRSSEDLLTSSQQYPDQLYHQQQLSQTPNSNNNGYPQQELIENYPNYQQIPPNFQQQFQQQQLPQNVGQAPQQYITQQQYQNILNQNQLRGQPYQGQFPNQQHLQTSQGIPLNQPGNLPLSGLPIAPTTVPLAIPILQKFLERPQEVLPEQLNIQQPQQPVPLPPQLYYVPQQQQAVPLGQLRGNQIGALNIVPQYQQQQLLQLKQQQLLQQQLQGQPLQTQPLQAQLLQQNSGNGISLRADLQDNLFPQNEDQKYQQPVFSINEPPPPSEQQIENPPQQQLNGVAQRYPLGPGFSNQLQSQVPVNVQNLPLVNTQPVFSGQQITQGINQGQPYYSAQGLPQQITPGFPSQNAPIQYSPQGQIPNYQDEQQQYDRPQPEQYNSNYQGNGPPNQGQEQSTEAPIKYNINDELPPISNFQDLLRTPNVNDMGNFIPQQQNLNTPSPDRLVYTTPDPQRYEDKIVGLRPPLREQDPFMRGDPGFRPTGQPSPVVAGLRDINIIPIDLVGRNSTDTKKAKYDLPNDLFTLPVHFATPNRTQEYQRQRQEDRLKLNAQNIQSLYDLQQANGQSNDDNKNINFLARNDLIKRASNVSEVEDAQSKQRTKRNYFYEHPRVPFNLPSEEDSYGSSSQNYGVTNNYLPPSNNYGGTNNYLPPLPPSNTFSPNYYGDIEIRYIPIYIPKPTDFFFIIRFCPVDGKNTTEPEMTTVVVDTAIKTTTSTITTETTILKDVSTTPATPEGTNSSSPSRCVWAIISCCSPGVEQRSQCFDTLGCQGVDTRNPCSPDVVANAVQQASSFYQNASDVLLREDRKRKFDDYDVDSGGGGDDFNQLFYDDFEVPENITISPDSLTSPAPVTSAVTRAVRRVTQRSRGTPRTRKSAPARTTTKKPEIKRGS